MRFTMAGINHQPLIVRLNHERLKELFLNTPVTPTAKSPMGTFPVSKVGRHAAPWRSRSQYPEYRVDKPPVLSSRTTHASFTARQMILYIFPYPIRNIVPTMCVHSLSCSGVKKLSHIVYNLTALEQFTLEIVHANESDGPGKVLYHLVVSLSPYGVSKGGHPYAGAAAPFGRRRQSDSWTIPFVICSIEERV